MFSDQKKKYEELIKQFEQVKKESELNYRKNSENELVLKDKEKKIAELQSQLEIRIKEIEELK